MMKEVAPYVMISKFWFISLVVLSCFCILVKSEDVPTILTCGQHCHCEAQKVHIWKENRIICNQTGSGPVVLTDAIYEYNQSDMTALQTYVRVEKGEHVTLTSKFLDKWKTFDSSALDIWSVQRLVLPYYFPANATYTGYTSAGIGIEDSNVDMLPDGLLAGKQRTKLRLVRSSVGFIQALLFKDVKYLSYLEVQDSSIGFIQGSEKNNELLVRQEDFQKMKYPVIFNNTFVGRMDSRALALRSEYTDVVYMQNVTIGQVATDGILLTNLKLVMNNSKVGDMQRNALNVNGSAVISITNSHMFAQPGALTHLPCSFHKHHIDSNDIISIFPQWSSTDLPYEDFDDKEISNNLSLSVPVRACPAEIVAKRLKLVLHSTCVEHNLPSSLSDFGCKPSNAVSKSVKEKSSSYIHAGLYSFVGFSIVALIIIVILAVVLANTRKGRTKKRSTSNPVIVMSQLQQEPIYDEPTTLLLSGPPPVPPPVAQSYSTGNSTIQQCSYSIDISSCDTSSVKHQKVENNYIFMK